MTDCRHFPSVSDAEESENWILEASIEDEYWPMY